MKKFLFTLISLCTIIKSVQAEDSVFNKSKSDYSPNGMHLGGFMLYPQLAVKQTYDDNIYSEKSSKNHDQITRVLPAIDLKSNWNVHQLNFSAKGNSGRYWQYNSENYNDYFLSTDGILEILEKTNLTGMVSYSKNHEDRGNPDRNLNAKSPTKYREANAKIGFERTLRKISLRVYQTAKSLDFQNNSTTNGTAVNNDFRNRNEYKTTARVDYELEPGHGIFTEFNKNFRKYNNEISKDRDSNGSDSRIGISLNVTGKTKAEAYIGYLNQNYNGTGYKDISAFNFGSGILWSPSETILIKFAGGRSAEETAIITYSGFVSNAFDATIEYELLRNLLFISNLSFAKNEYQSNFSENRVDNYTAFDIGSKYYLNRNFLLTLNYGNIRNSSTIQNAAYLKNVIAAGIEIKF